MYKYSIIQTTVEANSGNTYPVFARIRGDAPTEVEFDLKLSETGCSPVFYLYCVAKAVLLSGEESDPLPPELAEVGEYVTYFHSRGGQWRNHDLWTVERRYSPFGEGGEALYVAEAAIVRRNKRIWSYKLSFEIAFSIIRYLVGEAIMVGASGETSFFERRETPDGQYVHTLTREGLGRWCAWFEKDTGTKVLVTKEGDS